MNKVYIVAACRTPVGRFLGALKTVSAVELAALTVRHNLQQAGIDPAWIDEVICGSVLAAGQGMGPARQVALRAGIPVQKPAYTLNMICGSGMKSITEGAIHIQSGYADLVVAGGMENMSQAPFLLRGRDKGRHEIWRVQQRGSDPERWLNRSAVAYSDGGNGGGHRRA